MPRRASARRSAHVTTVLPLPLEGAATMKRGMVVLTGAAFPTCTTRADEEHGVLRLHKMVRAYSLARAADTWHASTP